MLSELWKIGKHYSYEKVTKWNPISVLTSVARKLGEAANASKDSRMVETCKNKITQKRSKIFKDK